MNIEKLVEAVTVRVRSTKWNIYFFSKNDIPTLLRIMISPFYVIYLTYYIRRYERHESVLISLKKTVLIFLSHYK